MSNLRKQNIQESYFLDTLLDVIYSQKLQEVIIYKGNISLAHKNIIIATANSNTQMNGVVKKITDVLQDKTSINVEGKDSTWLLIEVKEVLIHIFNKDSREFYNLEDIYFDCELIYQNQKGYGNALRLGIKNVDTDYLCIFNADLSLIHI